MTNLAAYALGLMLAKAPLSIADAPAYPGWSETQEQRLERYKGIAEAAAEVGKTKAVAAELLALSLHESGWSRDVDLGLCYRGKDGKSTRCDSGRAACLMQVRTDVHREYKAEELFADRKKCFAAGLAVLNRHKRQCAKLSPDHAYDGYASGSCLDGMSLSSVHARKTSLELFAMVKKFQSWVPATTLTPLDPTTPTAPSAPAPTENLTARLTPTPAS